MPRITSPAVLLPAVAALALSAGCTTTVSGAATADTAADAQSSEDTVAWVDQICGSLLPFVRAAGTPPQPREAPNPAALVDEISDYLGEVEDAAGEAVSGMSEAGPAPVAGGDEIIDRLSSTLETFQTSFRDARDRIDRVDVNDQQALRTEVPGAVASLEQLATMPNPMADLQGNPELNQAGREAASCQQIASEFGR